MRTISTAAAAVVACALALLGLSASPALALTGVPQTGPFMTGNLLSFANSDFEGTANYASVSNATITDSTAQAFLHTHALADTAASAGTSAFKLGQTSGQPTQINLTASATYTLGAYFKIPATSGENVHFSIACYDSSGTFIAWQDGANVSLAAQAAWQYAEEQVTIPSNCTRSFGAPKVTLGGVTAGQVTYMDEFKFTPYRPAQILGADAGNGGDATTWASANSSIGPMQEDKIFYSGAVPSSYSGSTCASLPSGVACVIAYKTQTTNLASYISGIPSDRAVIFVYHQEPENGDYTSGATFVSEFEGQANAIRSDSSSAQNIFVAQDSSSSGYGSGQPGANCSYVVPSGYVDAYLVDHYEFNPTGASYPTGQHSDTWNTWMNCVATGNPATSGTMPKPFGLAEFGYGVQSASCTSNPESTRNTTMGADGAYLEGLPATAGAPVIAWDYWWVDNTSVGACHDWNFPSSSTTAATWKGFETQNGGGSTP